MPIYEYVCEVCKHEFEELAHSMGSADKQTCPRCGEGRVTRKLSLFASPRTGGASSRSSMGGCQRCGDPQGPCSL